MRKWILANKALFSFLLVLPVVICVIIKDLNTKHEEKAVCATPSMAMAHRINDCRASEAPDQMIEISMTAGRSSECGSGAGCLSGNRCTIPAGGLHLASLPAQLTYGAVRQRASNNYVSNIHASMLVRAQHSSAMASRIAPTTHEYRYVSQGRGHLLKQQTLTALHPSMRGNLIGRL